MERRRTALPFPVPIPILIACSSAKQRLKCNVPVLGNYSIHMTAGLKLSSRLLPRKDEPREILIDSCLRVAATLLKRCCLSLLFLIYDLMSDSRRRISIGNTWQHFLLLTSFTGSCHVVHELYFIK